MEANLKYNVTRNKTCVKRSAKYYLCRCFLLPHHRLLLPHLMTQEEEPVKITFIDNAELMSDENRRHYVKLG